MTVEAVVSLGAAWFARSPALLGFGGDSAVELLSAAVVFWRFYSPSRGDLAERQTARIAGGILALCDGKDRRVRITQDQARDLIGPNLQCIAKNCPELIFWEPIAHGLNMFFHEEE
jgi:hypothetical protein